MKTLKVETKYDTVEIALNELEYSLLAVRLQLDPLCIGTEFAIESWLETKAGSYQNVVLLTQAEQAVRAEVTKAIAAPGLLEELAHSGKVSNECKLLYRNPDHGSNLESYVVAFRGGWFTYDIHQVMSDLLAITLEQVPGSPMARIKIGAWLQDLASEVQGVGTDKLVDILDEQVLLFISDRQVGHAYEQWQQDLHDTTGTRSAPTRQLMPGLIDG